MELVPPKLHLRTLLVPTDFSESSRQAISYAVALAQQFGSTVVLLHVIEVPFPYPVDGLMHFPGDLEGISLEQDAAAQKALTQLAEATARSGNVPVRSASRSGRAFDEIATAAGEENADLIVISTHGYTGLKHVFLGSTAERVVRHAPCPVLVVRQPERA